MNNTPLLSTPSVTITNSIVTSPPVLKISSPLNLGDPQVNILCGKNEPILEVFKDFESVVKLNRDGSVEWGEGYTPDDAAKSFGGALRSMIPVMAGMDDMAIKIIEKDLIEHLMNLADDEGPLSTADLKTAFEKINIMRKLKGPL